MSDHPLENPLDNAGINTLAIRAGIHRTAEGEHAEPIFATSSYVFNSAEEAAARFSGDEPGNVYSRYTNPTVNTFQERIAAMEGGEAAVATASGMAAILSTCMALLKAGDHVVCSRSVFGTTTVLFGKYLQKFGVKVSTVSLTDLAEWQGAITPATKLLFCETPSNPLCHVADIAGLAAIAKANDCLLAVDNCFCTPALQKPLALGADIIIHSATKYLDGQGRCLGGAVVGNKEHMAEVLGFIRTCGPTMSPFNAWVFSKGLETLGLRMKAHSANAQEIAEYLNSHPQVEATHYAGLPEHPGHALAAKQQSAFGGVLSFEVKGDKAACWRFINATRLMSLTANLGDAKTTIVHPATTTHGRLSAEDKATAGIKENLIRIAVGLEDVEDLITDLQRGFAAL
ncbi:O-succinylhomoserine sulfhydrylase [Marinagarivorans cellulosilyticus]|uniref:O-succinylhomoserine sulfhydrylase n=1 Tax=Marinagarivorans cellulosilyticus TaxID=2721545 RepID=A0AAN2BKR2_9GAMM|nr:O-succinylhomoserine sulfhydrylase [Marinagarivorans cellulosilyticus]BCD98281.1 O-succinylhomoserine sulfhydrylase [Marinagarivorans cellulosilyticus]